MLRHTRAAVHALVLGVVALGLAACSSPDASGPTALDGGDLSYASGGEKNVVKFTFEDVTLTDGDLVVENGVIEAAVRDHKKDKNDWTNCSYYTEDWAGSLGSFGVGALPEAGTGAEAVENFCTEHFSDRQ